MEFLRKKVSETVRLDQKRKVSELTSIPNLKLRRNCESIRTIPIGKRLLTRLYKIHSPPLIGCQKRVLSTQGQPGYNLSYMICHKIPR